MRSTALVAGAAVLALAAPATAKPYCALLKPTAANDTPTPGSAAWQETLLPGSTGPYRMRSADIAADARYVTVVWRPRALTSTDPTAPLHGRVFAFNFSVAGRDHYHVSVSVPRFGDPGGTVTWLSAPQPAPGGAAQTVETRKVADIAAVVDPSGEIRTGIPVAALGRLPRGTLLTQLSAASYVDYADRSVRQYDRLSGFSATYPVGAKSCVRAWR